MEEAEGSLEKLANREPLLIESHAVAFPYAPYASQKLVIVRVLQGLKNGRNCLIESPTGSGKTLALLCSSLAWQANQKEIYRAQIEKLEQALQERQNEDWNANMGAACGIPLKQATPATNEVMLSTPNRSSSSCGTPIKCGSRSSTMPSTCASAVAAPGTPTVTKTTAVRAVKVPTPQAKHFVITNVINIDSSGGDDDDDFQPAKKKRQSVNMVATNTRIASQPADKSVLKAKPSTSIPNKEASAAVAQPAMPEKDAECPENKPIRKVPVIYYGTRTHKQIAQVVRELKKTEYKHVRMTVLSSRERTCIHPRISRSANKNEECKELLDDLGCMFQGSMRKRQEYPTAYEPFDLEDLVKIGRKERVCPYFWSRDLAMTADIVFCPYNYLIDPVVRQCMDIHLDNTVVILDEAHNIEDVSRDVMSFNITQDQIKDIIDDLEEMQRLQIKPNEHYQVARVMSRLSTWISQNSDHLDDYRSFEKSGKVWSGTEIIAFMTDIGLSPDHFCDFRKLIAVITTAEKDNEKNPDAYQPVLHSSTAAVLQNLVIILDFVYRGSMKYMDDFRAAIVKSASKGSRRSEGGNTWRSKSSARNSSWTHTLSLWCLNPAVAMSDIKDKVHSLIVASGTLSPMESFESELGMSFKSQLQAKHVIPPDGVWIGGIAYGPSRQNLTANFRNTETFVFQDEIGTILFDISKAVPYGVLCFFPSYSMMNKLAQRWKNTGIWDQIAEHKYIVMEPQKADSDTFDAIMADYFTHATMTGDETYGTGALLLAVCRGKVSEGLDFPDNSARAVVTVGIPFPNVKDIQVDLKRKYNDQAKKAGRPVMNGSFWYETQAFRALNQALGRCIRHRLDWGALIVVDHRFAERDRFKNALSKWIRDKFHCFTHYEDAMTSLKAFMDSKMKDMNSQFANTEDASTSEPNLVPLSNSEHDYGAGNCCFGLTAGVSEPMDTSGIMEVIKDDCQGTSDISRNESIVERTNCMDGCTVISENQDGMLLDVSNDALILSSQDTITLSPLPSPESPELF